MEKKIINQVLSITSVNRQLNAVYENEYGRYERPIIFMAQVLYTDTSHGFELMDLDDYGKTLFISSRKGFKYIKEIKELDKKYDTERDLEILKLKESNPFIP